jgi:hypothetical protein
MHLYKQDKVCQVGLSYLGCRRFYEAAQAQDHGVDVSTGLDSVIMSSPITMLLVALRLIRCSARIYAGSALNMH